VEDPFKDTSGPLTQRFEYMYIHTYIHTNTQTHTNTHTHIYIQGDTVGDPFKDTSGPSLNVLIKLMSLVALVMAPIFRADIQVCIYIYECVCIFV